MIENKKKDNMNRKMMNKWIFGAALLLFAACTQDELTDGPDTLPEGMYPLQISGITLEAESSSQPWGAGAPQTRVSENQDRNSSVWDGGEEIGVKIAGGEETAIYTLQADKTTLASDNPLYWKSKTARKVYAWYPADGKVDLSGQTTQNGLAYVLHGQTASDVAYNTDKITLSFAHKLAKVRVVLQGSDKDKVEDVKLKTYSSCTLNTDGTLTAGTEERFIPMVKTTYKGETCWEANVVPGHTITKFQLNNTTAGTLDDKGITLIAAKVNTITLTVGNREYTPSDENQTLNLNDGDVVNITGNGNYTSGNFTINIQTGNTATVNLSNVKMKKEEENNGTPAFNINGGGTVVFNLNGTENEIDGFGRGLRGDWNGTAANIHVIGPGKLTITGPNVNGGIVTDKEKDILIKDATIVMKYEYASGTTPNAAIGSGSTEECGDITIINSDISIKIATDFQDGTHTADNWFGAAIGPGRNGTCGNISITLQKGQTKEQFLNGISVRHTTLNAALTDEQKVGQGLFGQSCGTVTWLNADGTSAN